MKVMHYLYGVADMIISMTENGYREQAAESLSRMYLKNYLKPHDCLFVCSIVLQNIYNKEDLDFWDGEWDDYHTAQIEYFRHK